MITYDPLSKQDFEACLEWVNAFVYGRDSKPYTDDEIKEMGKPKPKPVVGKYEEYERETT